MNQPVKCEIDDGIATITLDDGKVNVLSLAMQSAISAALDQAEAEGAVVIITGRERVFSAGFDLATLRGGGTDGASMLWGGFELALRVLTFPTPVVMAVNGHAIAMGLFFMICADHRVGAQGSSRLTANEVAIGMTLPQAAIDICQLKLNPAYLSRVLLLAEVFSPDDAVAAGILDCTVAYDSLLDEARTTAAALKALSLPAHHATKLATRAQGIAALRASIDAGKKASGL